MSHTQRTITSATGLCALGTLLLISGCASSQPAPQFTEAQRTYAEASQGKAGEFAPDVLLESKNLLDRAENAKNGSEQQVHLAYLADRHARLAASSGTIEYYQGEAGRAEAQYISGLEQKSESATDQLQDQQHQLSAKDAALSESERARQDAERRAQAALASLNELAQVKEEANVTVITLSGSVLFKTGEASLLPIAENSLSKVAEAIKTMDEEKQIVIEGHTDSRGDAAMNKELSQKRAQSVLNYLAQEGVAKSRMKAEGKGESDPVADNDSAEGQANNRRVELHISGGSNKKSATATEATTGPRAGL